MPTFTLSRANSLHFEIQTGGSAINSGAYYRANYRYENIGTFFNRATELPGVEDWGNSFYHTDEVTTLQFVYDKDSQAPGIVIENADTGAAVEDIGATLVNVSENIYSASIDWSLIGEGCYVVKIKTFNAAVLSPNFFSEMDSGTAELNISNIDTSDTGNFIVTRSSAQAQAGTWSARVEHTGGGPVADDKMLFVQDSTAYEAVLGEMHFIAGYVYVPSGTPIATLGSDTTIRWAVDNADGFGTSGPSRPGFGADTIIINEVVWNSEAPGVYDAWNLIYCVFMTTAGNTFGNFRIEADKTPASGGIMYVDTVNFLGATETTEAISEKVIIKTNHPCTSLVEWTNDNDAFGIDYTTTPITFRARLSTQKGFASSWNDEDYQIKDNSSGASSVQLSNGKVSDIWEFVGLTQNMFEKLMIASSHDTFKIDGVEYIRVDDAVAAEFNEASGIADPLQIEFQPKTYNMKNTAC